MANQRVVEATNALVKVLENRGLIGNHDEREVLIDALGVLSDHLYDTESE